MKFTALHTRQGFTLIELLVVILILGLLAGIVGPRLFGRAEEAKRAKAVTQITHIGTALKMYKLDNGYYPTTEQGLNALVAEPQTEPLPRKWKKGGYLEKKKIPKDPWNNEYIFLSPGTHDDVDISSYGADGVPGGEDDNRDINSWEVE